VQPETPAALGWLKEGGGAKMASNKGKTHMAASPVNMPPETNGGRLAYPSTAQDTENLRAMLEDKAAKRH